MYILRAVGGTLYLAALLMVYNLSRPCAGRVRARDEAQAPPLEDRPHRRRGTRGTAARAQARALPVLSLVAVAIGGLVEIVPMF
jgi:cytochrome c oxidase cbb3-type subunit I/II